MTDRKFTPHLREGLGARPEEFARSTCFEGGYLTSVNAGWRSLRPLIDPVQCTLCLNCYMYCPDGTIFKVRDGEGVCTALAIDYDFCKGCGVCAKVCPVPCIAMVDERGDGEVAAGISAARPSAFCSDGSRTSCPVPQSEDCLSESRCPRPPLGKMQKEVRHEEVPLGQRGLR